MYDYWVLGPVGSGLIGLRLGVHGLGLRRLRVEGWAFGASGQDLWIWGLDCGA